MSQLASFALVNDQQLSQEIRVEKPCQMLEFSWPGAPINVDGIPTLEAPLSSGSFLPDQMLLVTIDLNDRRGGVKNLCTELSLYDLHRLNLQSTKGACVFPLTQFGFRFGDPSDGLAARPKGRQFRFLVDLTPLEANVPVSTERYLSVYVRLNRGGLTGPDATVPVNINVFAHETTVTGNLFLRYESETFAAGTAPVTRTKNISMYDALLWPYIQQPGTVTGQRLSAGWQQLRFRNGAQRNAGNELLILPDMVEMRTLLDDTIIMLNPNMSKLPATSEDRWTIPAGTVFSTGYDKLSDVDFANYFDDEAQDGAQRFARLLEIVNEWEEMELTHTFQQRLVYRRPVELRADGELIGA